MIEARKFLHGVKDISRWYTTSRPGSGITVYACSLCSVSCSSRSLSKFINKQAQPSEWVRLQSTVKGFVGIHTLASRFRLGECPIFDDLRPLAMPPIDVECRERPPFGLIELCNLIETVIDFDESKLAQRMCVREGKPFAHVLHDHLP
jgi:hypothetical protein